MKVCSPPRSRAEGPRLRLLPISPLASPPREARGAGSGRGALCRCDHAGHGGADRSAADPADPIARQFVPDTAELDLGPQERADPIGDDAHEVVEGLIHRYPDRVLLKLVSDLRGLLPLLLPARNRRARRRQGCCRRRRSMRRSPYPRPFRDLGGDRLRRRPARRLAAPARRPDAGALAAIDHVKVVRFHTRVPVVAPERVTAEMVDALMAGGKATWLAVHANHPRELTADARAALARLADAGIPLVSQTVLLRGVNDDAETLGALMRAFVEMPGEALLSPPWRPRAGHGPFPHDHRRGPGADAGAPRARLRASASRPMSSTSPAATARRRSVSSSGSIRLTISSARLPSRMTSSGSIAL